MKLNEKIKKPIIYGVIFLSIVLFVEAIILLTCKNDLFCLGLSFVILVPGMILGLPQGSYIEIIFDAIFYFALGALVGFLVQRLKRKNESKKID